MPKTPRFRTLGQGHSSTELWSSLEDATRVGTLHPERALEFEFWNELTAARPKIKSYETARVQGRWRPRFIGPQAWEQECRKGADLEDLRVIWAAQLPPSWTLRPLLRPGAPTPDMLSGARRERVTELSQLSDTRLNWLGLRRTSELCRVFSEWHPRVLDPVRTAEIQISQLRRARSLLEFQAANRAPEQAMRLLAGEEPVSESVARWKDETFGQRQLHALALDQALRRCLSPQERRELLPWGLGDWLPWQGLDDWAGFWARLRAELRAEWLRCCATVGTVMVCPPLSTAATGATAAPTDTPAPSAIDSSLVESLNVARLLGMDVNTESSYNAVITLLEGEHAHGERGKHQWTPVVGTQLSGQTVTIQTMNLGNWRNGHLKSVIDGATERALGRATAPLAGWAVLAAAGRGARPWLPLALSAERRPDWAAELAEYV